MTTPRADKHVTLGRVIRTARVKKDLTQKGLAARVKKEDGTPITPQYLNDLEHDRRTPSEYVATQLADELDLEAGYLVLLSGQLPRDILEGGLDEATAGEALRLFRGKPKKRG